MEESKKTKIRDLHQNELGYKTPDDYFASAKKEMLGKIALQQEPKVLPIYRRRYFWALAASIAILVSIVVFQPEGLPKVDELPQIVQDTIERMNEKQATELALAQDENDILVSSLFLDEDEIDTLVESSIVEEIVLEEVLSQ